MTSSPRRLKQFKEPVKRASLFSRIVSGCNPLKKQQNAQGQRMPTSDSGSRSAYSRENQELAKPLDGLLSCFRWSSQVEIFESQAYSPQRGSVSIGEFQPAGRRGSSLEFNRISKLLISSSPSSTNSAPVCRFSFEDLRCSPHRSCEKDERGFLDRAFENAAAIDDELFATSFD